LKEEALHRTIWRHRFGGGFGPVVRQNTEWMNEYNWSNGKDWKPGPPYLKWTKCHCDRFFSEFCGFHPLVSFNNFSTLLFQSSYINAV